MEPRRSQRLVSQFIPDESEENILENDEIQHIDDDGQVNVFHLVKFTQAGLVELHEHLPNVVENKPENDLTSLRYGKRRKFPKYYKQTYRPAWESMPDFQGWLNPVKGQPTRAYCIYCQKTLHAHRLSLLKHTCTIRHQKAAQSCKILQQQQQQGTSNNQEIQTLLINSTDILSDNSNASNNLNNELLQPQFTYVTKSENEEDQLNENDQLVENDQMVEDDQIVKNDEFFEETEEPNSAVDTQNNDQSQNIVESSQPNSGQISTNVIDTARGRPVVGLAVSLYRLVNGRWTFISEGITDSKGYFSNFFKEAAYINGRYKLHYDVDRYFAANDQYSPFPFIETIFDSTTITPMNFPLLLGPNNYSTYRSNSS